MTHGRPSSRGRHHPRRRFDAHQCVVDGTIEPPAIDDHVVVEGEDRLEPFLFAGDAGIPAPAQRFQEQHPTLAAVFDIFAPGIRRVGSHELRQQRLPLRHRRAGRLGLAARHRFPVPQAEPAHQRPLRNGLGPDLIESLRIALATMCELVGIDHRLNPGCCWSASMWFTQRLPRRWAPRSVRMTYASAARHTLRCIKEAPYPPGSIPDDRTMTVWFGNYRLMGQARAELFTQPRRRTRPWPVARDGSL